MRAIDSRSGLAFLVSQLTYIEKTLYEQQYQEIIYDKLIPVTTEAGEWATSITYYYMSGTAIAEFIGSKALDIPIAEVGSDGVTVPVVYGATGYQYTHEEIRQAIYLNRPLPQMKANNARRAYEELTHRTAMIGDIKRKLLGFVNNPNVNSSVVVDPGSGTEWVNKTPDQILTDINNGMGSIFVDSLQIERADTLLLPTAQWNHISGTPRSPNSDLTILRWVINNSPYLTSDANVIPVAELAGAGVGNTNRMIAYKKDIGKLKMHIPLPLRFLEVQAFGLGYKVPGEFKIGGVEWMYPGSARYIDGI